MKLYDLYSIPIFSKVFKGTSTKRDVRIISRQVQSFAVINRQTGGKRERERERQRQKERESTSLGRVHECTIVTLDDVRVYVGTVSPEFSSPKVLATASSLL